MSEGRQYVPPDMAAFFMDASMHSHNLLFVCNNSDVNELMSKWFKQDESAIEWARMLWDTIQLWDDIYDGDEVDKNHLNLVMLNTMTKMTTNLFYLRHVSKLSAQLESCILQWITANRYEEVEDQDIGGYERAFILRAGYYSMMHYITYLIGGLAWADQHSTEIWSSYGETFEQYLKEF